MKYALITKNGKVFTFFVEETAKIYQQAYGGVVFLLLNTENELTEAKNATTITL
jgi:predicted adenine nucleotide alpha hydrolase (AANH) superfamily ATPase